MKHALVVATSNRGKLEEFRALLADLPVNVLAIGDVLPHPPVIVEDGRTFAENAIKKAVAVAAASTMLTLGDDSGLEVDVLDGRPGVRSARFAHERATDAENNAALLEALEKSADDPGLDPGGSFRARFRCSLALIDPFSARPGRRSSPPAAGDSPLRDVAPLVVDGTCEGAIVRQPRGSGGFGYDPLFVVDGMDKTMAELEEAEKNRVSHRARAFGALRPLLSELLFARDRRIREICG